MHLHTQRLNMFEKHVQKKKRKIGPECGLAENLKLLFSHKKIAPSHTKKTKIAPMAVNRCSLLKHLY